jgi:hypothetical protein
VLQGTLSPFFAYVFQSVELEVTCFWGELGVAWVLTGLRFLTQRGGFDPPLTSVGVSEFCNKIQGDTRVLLCNPRVILRDAKVALGTSPGRLKLRLSLHLVGVLFLVLNPTKSAYPLDDTQLFRWCPLWGGECFPEPQIPQ